MKFREIISSINKKLPIPIRISKYSTKLNSNVSDNNLRLLRKKIELIDFVLKKNKNSFCFVDLGGIWGVDGGYTFYILENYNIKKAFLIDNLISNLTFKKSLKFPQLELYMLNFGSDKAVSKVSNVDAILLFDVLLHQVNPDWDEVLTKYATHTKYFIIFNQQFEAEKTVRLIELGKKEYFRQILNTNNTSTYEYSLLFTDRKEEVKNSPNIWQWGITDKDLLDKMKELNFKLIYSNIGQRWGKTKFTSRGFVFKQVE